MTCLMWFRDDLRLHDNQALCRAAEAASLGDAPLGRRRPRRARLSRHPPARRRDHVVARALPLFPRPRPR